MLVSAAANKGVTEILRALAAIIDEQRVIEDKSGHVDEAWHP